MCLPKKADRESGPSARDDPFTRAKRATRARSGHLMTLKDLKEFLDTRLPSVSLRSSPKRVTRRLNIFLHYIFVSSVFRLFPCYFQSSVRSLAYVRYISVASLRYLVYEQDYNVLIDIAAYGGTLWFTQVIFVQVNGLVRARCAKQ